MMKRLHDLLERLTAWLDELLFPGEVACLCCDRALLEEDSDGLCAACQEALEALGVRQEQWERTHDIAPPAGVAYVHAAYPYEAQARRLVHRLKYDRIRAAHVPLARPMVYLPSMEEEIIVPVPTDKKRRRRRGFNQADLLAQYVGEALGMQVIHALVRRQSRRPQTGLTAEQRRHNLAGCMEADAAVSGKRVLLIDDVYTTGATVAEAARALLEAGAKSVGVFAAAKTRDEAFFEKDPFALPLRRGKGGKNSENP